MPTSPARSDVTRTATLDAARQEFAAFGYRRSSVDSIARRAGISRATLYLHWTGKQHLFRDLVERLHDEHLRAMQRILDHPPGGIHAALVGILEARFATFVELTAGSPNAAELYDVHDRICGDIARQAQKRALALVTRLLDRASREGTVSLQASGLTARQAADVLLDCAHAAKGEDPATATPAAYRARLDRLVRLLIHGLAPAG